MCIFTTRQVALSGVIVSGGPLECPDAPEHLSQRGMPLLRDHYSAALLISSRASAGGRVDVIRAHSGIARMCLSVESGASFGAQPLPESKDTSIDHSRARERQLHRKRSTSLEDGMRLPRFGAKGRPSGSGASPPLALPAPPALPRGPSQARPGFAGQARCVDELSYPSRDEVAAGVGRLLARLEGSPPASGCLR